MCNLQLIFQNNKNEIHGVTPGVGIISFQIQYLGGFGVTPGVALTLRYGIGVTLKPRPNTNTNNKILKKTRNEMLLWCWCLHPVLV
jgi:hypothetical protein